MNGVISITLQGASASRRLNFYRPILICGFGYSVNQVTQSGSFLILSFDNNPSVSRFTYRSVGIGNFDDVDLCKRFIIQRPGAFDNLTDTYDIEKKLYCNSITAITGGSAGFLVNVFYNIKFLKDTFSRV